MEQLRERYISAIGELVGRSKKFPTLKAYIAASGDNYSTISKVLNRYDHAWPTVESLMHIVVLGGIDAHWLLTGTKPKSNNDTRSEERLTEIEARILKLEKLA